MNDEIDLHSHPDMTGGILCLAGEIEVESFNLLDEVSDDGKLLLERVEQKTLTTGLFSTLTANRNTIHGLRARMYTALLDVFTPPYDKDRSDRFRWYERELVPIEGTEIFEAWET